MRDEIDELVDWQLSKREGGRRPLPHQPKPTPPPAPPAAAPAPAVPPAAPPATPPRRGLFGAIVDRITTTINPRLPPQYTKRPPPWTR